MIRKSTKNYGRNILQIDDFYAFDGLMISHAIIIMLSSHQAFKGFIYRKSNYQFFKLQQKRL